MKFRALLVSLSIAFSSSVFALMPPEPERCPSVSALKSMPFFMAQEDQNGNGYAAISMGNYQTQENWGFVMAFIEASNMFEAIMIANQALPGVYGDPEPMPFEEQNVWVCMYGVEAGYQAIAVEPLQMGGLTSLPKFLHK